MICCGFPSSSSTKSDGVSPAGTFPFASRTTTGTSIAETSIRSLTWANSEVAKKRARTTAARGFNRDLQAATSAAIITERGIAKSRESVKENESYTRKMVSFQKALLAVNDLKASGIIDQYAIAGAMALTFWIEPIPTYDLDVLVMLPQSDNPLVSLEPIYRWASERDYKARDEHLVIEGVPVQFLPSFGVLADEAIRTAADRQYDGVPLRVVTPEYLILLFLLPSARTLKRRERAAALLDSANIDRDKLDDLMRRFNLTF